MNTPTLSTQNDITRPPAWAVLQHGLITRTPVHVHYHGHERLLCPHALGFKNGRAKVLSYQAAGSTSNTTLPHDPRQRWRSMFTDEIEDPTITNATWETADNYTPTHNGIDQLDIEITTHHH